MLLFDFYRFHYLYYYYYYFVAASSVAAVADVTCTGSSAAASAVAFASLSSYWLRSPAPDVFAVFIVTVTEAAVVTIYDDGDCLSCWSWTATAAVDMIVLVLHCYDCF